MVHLECVCGDRGSSAGSIRRRYNSTLGQAARDRRGDSRKGNFLAYSFLHLLHAAQLIVFRR